MLRTKNRFVRLVEGPRQAFGKSRLKTRLLAPTVTALGLELEMSQ